MHTDVVDFAAFDADAHQAAASGQPLPDVDCAGVVFFGLQTVLPLVSPELLQVRCDEYSCRGISGGIILPRNSKEFQKPF